MPDDPKLLHPSNIDTDYKAFPAFSKWSQLSVEGERWEAHRKILQELGADDPVLLKRAREVAKRAAAIDTGAIEGLYDLDAGFTISVAAQVGIWQAAFAQKEQKTRDLIEAQLSAYDEVIDLATGSAPFAAAWIRGLHETLCKAQGTYVVQTPQGTQEQLLPLGEYKKYPNHVLKPDGSYHAYAPVVSTPSEMQRLLNELTTPEFVTAHPVLQAAYSHYALTVIHPFADGNGRVARALASVYLYRAASIPFMVLVEHRSPYLESIREADGGNPLRFVDFTFERCLDAFRLIAESMRAARYPSSLAGAAAAKKLHLTHGGYTHAQVDEAGWSLLADLEKKANEMCQGITTATQLNAIVQRVRVDFPPPPKGFRNPIAGSQGAVQVYLQSLPPAAAESVVRFVFQVPFDASPDDEIVVRCLLTGGEFRVVMREAVAKRSVVLLLRIAMFVEGILGAALAALTETAEKSLRAQGYIQ